MPGNIYWAEEPWILAVDYSSSVTADDVKKAAMESITAMQRGPVYFLIDLSESDSVETRAVETALFSEWIYHPNARWFAYVKASGLFRSLVQVRHRDSAKFFDNRDAALAFLERAVHYATTQE